jgi:hypothetical protein
MNATYVWPWLRRMTQSRHAHAPQHPSKKQVLLAGQQHQAVVFAVHGHPQI